MADIDVQCTKCSHSMMLSEFADLGAMTCPACGSSMAGIRNAPDGPARPALKVRRKLPPPPASHPAGESQSDKMGYLFKPGRDRTPHQKISLAGTRQSLIVWGIFVLCGTGSVALRYLDLVPGAVLWIRDYGWIVIALLYVLTVLSAFKESTLQGLLCLLVPGYFLYFLIMFDCAYLRAVTFGLLAGFGADTWRWIGDLWSRFYTQAMDWILSGGA